MPLISETPFAMTSFLTNGHLHPNNSRHGNFCSPSTAGLSGAMLHSQFGIGRNKEQTYMQKDGEPLTNVHFLMSRYLTHMHHPTSGFSSLPVMPIMNESNGACISRGSTKLSWHPSLHSFSAPLEAWANTLKYSTDALLTRLPPKPNNYIPAPSHGSDAG